jgi:large subunit ribosomal protein L21
MPNFERESPPQGARSDLVEGIRPDAVMANAETTPHSPHLPHLIVKPRCCKLKVYSSGADALGVLRLQPRFPMNAIIETGGKQYRVAPGDVIRVEKIPGDVGAEIELPVKAAFADGGELVSGATVKATIVGNGRGDKVVVFKFKRKKQYKKTIGHRQSFTEVKVGEIVA